MGQSSNVLLTIDKVHTLPKRALDCKPGLDDTINNISGGK